VKENMANNTIRLLAERKTETRGEKITKNTNDKHNKIGIIKTEVNVEGFIQNGQSAILIIVGKEEGKEELK